MKRVLRENFEFETDEPLERYSEIIFDEVFFSSDNLNAVIDSAISDYENGESGGEDIEIFDNLKQKVIWTTSDSD